MLFKVLRSEVRLDENTRAIIGDSHVDHATAQMQLKPLLNHDYPRLYIKLNGAPQAQQVAAGGVS